MCVPGPSASIKEEMPLTTTDDLDYENRFAMTGDVAPVARFTSAEYLELEYEKLWPFVWQVVCTEDEIPRIGDYVEYSIGPYAVVVVRSAPDTIKAVSNSCMHRGRRLKDQRSRGNVPELRCPYHGWRYHLDGSIKEVHDPQDFDPELVEPDCLKLPEARVETLFGLVWLNFDSAAAPLIETLALPKSFDIGRYAVGRMVTVRHRQTVMQSNWQIGMDSFLDASHLTGSHPQTVFYLDDTEASYRRGAERPRSGEFMPVSSRIGRRPVPFRERVEAWARDQTAAGFTMFDIDQVDPAEIDAMPDDCAMGPWLAEKIRRQYEAMEVGLDLSDWSDWDVVKFNSWAAFPNAAMAFTPVTCQVVTVRPNGLDPDTCIWDWWDRRLLPESEQPKAPVPLEFYEDFYAHDDWGRVYMQDLGNTQACQQGMHNKLLEFVRLGRGGEAGSAELFRRLDDYLTRER